MYCIVLYCLISTFYFRANNLLPLTQFGCHSLKSSKTFFWKYLRILHFPVTGVKSFASDLIFSCFWHCWSLFTNLAIWNFFEISDSCLEWISSYHFNRKSLVFMNKLYSTLSFQFSVSQSFVFVFVFLFFIHLSSQKLNFSRYFPIVFVQNLHKYYWNSLPSNFITFLLSFR